MKYLNIEFNNIDFYKIIKIDSDEIIRISLNPFSIKNTFCKYNNNYKNNCFYITPIKLNIPIGPNIMTFEEKNFSIILNKYSSNIHDIIEYINSFLIISPSMYDKHIKILIIILNNYSIPVPFYLINKKL